VETVGAGQRIRLGEWVGKRRDWFFEQTEDRPVGGVPKRLRQPFKLIPGPVRKRRTRSLTNSPRLRKLLAGKGPAFPGI